MIVGIGRRGGALLFVTLFVVGFVVVPRVGPTTTPPTPPPTQAHSPPPREESPFSEPDTFCVPSENRFASVAPNDPRVRAQAVTVAMLVPPGADVSEVTTEAQTFADLIDRCGGVGGQRFDLRVVPEIGDPVVDCLDVTARLHPALVVSLAATPAQQCITRDQRTILVTESDASNADLGASSGRLAATGSAEGIERARLVDLVASGRLDGRAVAVTDGNDPGDAEFAQTARAVLAASKIRVVELGRASVVLEPVLDVATVPLLTAVTAAGRGRQPLDVYGFSPAADTDLVQLQQVSGADPVRMLRAANLFAYTPVSDPRYRADHSPNTFTEMCNQAYANALPKRVSSTTTTLAPNAPLSATYLQVADVCLALRIAARAAFAAGPDAGQPALVTALHRLPYLDDAAPGGTPKARPNQVVNEPVTRIAQVVVLSQVQSPCPASGSTRTSTTVEGTSSSCWAPASGWDDGGRVVNVPLVPSA
jgi:hypothetical protein